MAQSAVIAPIGSGSTPINIGAFGSPTQAGNTVVLLFLQCYRPNGTRRCAARDTLASQETAKDTGTVNMLASLTNSV
jgi:hypothetical protein